MDKGKIAYGLLLVGLLGINIFMVYKVADLQEVMYKLNGQIKILETRVSDQINRGIKSINDAQQEKSSIVSSYEINYGELNPENLTVPISVVFSPKEYVNGTLAFLDIRSTDTLHQPAPMKNIGVSYIATFDVSIFNDYDISVFLDDGTVKKVAPLEKIYNNPDNYIARPQGHFSGKYSYNKTNLTYNGKIDTFFSDDKNLKDVKLVVEVADEIVYEQALNSYSSAVVFNKNIPVQPNQHVSIYLTAKDNYGLSYISIVSVIAIKENSAVEDQISGYNNSMLEIRNKYNKVIYSDVPKGFDVG